ncbi:hypothetical protein FRX31_034166 [Thalictrum thalictroides]|uniref:Uncharacterized protein n=1 Tax=Thalictrum thalictroides TaxID=46969 RepID=A0A7J6UUU7_THATH|nr:hypothetical protein FRX31_034166 [Thalictrum thalictroides]
MSQNLFLRYLFTSVDSSYFSTNAYPFATRPCLLVVSRCLLNGLEDGRQTYNQTVWCIASALSPFHNKHVPKTDCLRLELKMRGCHVSFYIFWQDGKLYKQNHITSIY